MQNPTSPKSDGNRSSFLDSFSGILFGLLVGLGAGLAICQLTS